MLSVIVINPSIHSSNSRTCHFLKWSCFCQQEMRVSKNFGRGTSCLSPEVLQESCQQYINCNWDLQEDLCSKWQGYSKIWWFKNFFEQEGTRRPQNVDQQTRRSVKLSCFFSSCRPLRFLEQDPHSTLFYPHISPLGLSNHQFWSACVTTSFGCSGMNCLATALTSGLYTTAILHRSWVQASHVRKHAKQWLSC